VQARAMIVTTAGAIAGLISVAGALTVPVLVPVLLALAGFAALLPSLARRQRALTLADEHTSATAGSIVAGVRDIVACGAEPVAALTADEALAGQAAAAVRVARSGALRSLVVALGGFVPLVLALALAPGMVARGELTAGAALGALVYLATTLQPALRGLAATASTVVLRVLVALRRLAETSAAPEPRPATGIPAGPELRVHDLTFRWGAAPEPVVRGLHLSLRPGDHLAVVGPSGIGKSTLAGLLTGLLPPQHGWVRLGGVPIAEVADRPRRVVLVPQQAYVFTGTVRENLALFRPEAGDRLLIAAAHAVGAGNLLARLGGLDGGLGHDAEGLSAGEAQLIALARAYASAAGIVVLDEATSALDPAAEVRAERAFADRGGVLVVIAHRLSSAVRARRVLLMDGRETVLGSHAELVGVPRYAEMMRAWLPETAGSETPGSEAAGSGAAVDGGVGELAR